MKILNKKKRKKLNLSFKNYIGKRKHDLFNIIYYNY